MCCVWANLRVRLGIFEGSWHCYHFVRSPRAAKGQLFNDWQQLLLAVCFESPQPKEELTLGVHYVWVGGGLSKYVSQIGAVRHVAKYVALQDAAYSPRTRVNMMGRPCV